MSHRDSDESSSHQSEDAEEEEEPEEQQQQQQFQESPSSFVRRKSSERDLDSISEVTSLDNSSVTGGSPTAPANRDGGEDGVVTEVFEELILPGNVARSVHDLWSLFLSTTGSREVAGEAIYSVLLDHAPSLQSLFKMPRAVMAMRLTNGLQAIVGALEDPKNLKLVVEGLGYRHIHLEVTVPRVVLFRDAILDLFRVELADRASPEMLEGWKTVLSYVGGAFVYVRAKYTDRLRILTTSWATANHRGGQSLEDEEGDTVVAVDAQAAQAGAGAQLALPTPAQGSPSRRRRDSGGGGSGGGTGGGSSGERAAKGGKRSWLTSTVMNLIMPPVATTKSDLRNGAHGSQAHSAGGGGAAGGTPADRAAERAREREQDQFEGQVVPMTFDEMFRFNAVVMGLSGNGWMSEVLSSFGNIVTNAGDPNRLQEECDVILLRLAKHKGPINLAEYKAVMLASLRSLVPKDWNSAHEVAWSWLWGNVERVVKDGLGKPARQMRALETFVSGLDEVRLQKLNSAAFGRFFEIAPAAQDFFRMSNTRLTFIATRILGMTLEMYKDPQMMVEELSALGLRHVGYDVPTDLFGPFVTACIQVVRETAKDEAAQEAFSWSLSLISRIMVRTINEGSTIVMKAINANSAKMLRKAVSCAPRGERSTWMLRIQVGTHSISPLAWAVESGRLEAAQAIITDLLTIRADRDRYYYGLDDIFERHPDVIRRLCLEAPSLLPTFLDGLIWRSRTTERGQRRVNYYVKHLLLGPDGQFSKALPWITEYGDPKIACHPAVRLVADLVWDGAAVFPFLQKNAWYVFALVVFVISQSILVEIGRDSHSQAQGALIMAIRIFIYLRCMVRLLIQNSVRMVLTLKRKTFAKAYGIWLPAYLVDYQESAAFILMIVLVLMFSHEPITYCLVSHGLVADQCEAAESVYFRYSVFSMIAMFLYWMRLLDMTVFSTRVSAFALVCGQVLPEFLLFAVSMAFLGAMFSTSITALSQQNEDFTNIGDGWESLIEVTLGMYRGDNFEALRTEPVLMIVIMVYTALTVLFFINLLIAQMNSSYQLVYEDMVGYARLKRSKIISEIMPVVSKKRWTTFVESLKFDQKLEFNEGDVGLAGGVQVLEPAGEHITTVETILRFGGSTAAEAPWPDEKAEAGEDDRLQRMEKLMGGILHKSSALVGKGGSKAGGSQMGSHSSGSFASRHSGGGEDQDT